MWQTDVVEMHPYSRFNKDHYTFTVIDVLSKYAWAVPLKSKAGNESRSYRPDSREREMSEESTNRYGKGVLQR